MSSDFADKGTLKQSTVETLIASLSLDLKERLKAEGQIKVLETAEDFGLILTEIIIETSFPSEIRQLASVVLKQYVDCHWSAIFEEKFHPPEVSQDTKAIIRQNLPNGLQDECSKIRSSVAYAMSRIASFDWPNDWPELFTLLIQALQSMNPNVIHGAMRVFSELAGELSDLQIPYVAPILFPEMLKIFVHPEMYGIRTSGRAVNIIATISGLIGLMKEVYKGVDKQHLYPHLPQFLNVCGQHLLVPDGPSTDCGLKMEILKALEVLIKHFPKALSNSINIILPPVWKIFTESVEQYVKTAVNGIDETEDLVDEDGELLCFESLVFSVFDFISALVETPKFKKTVEQYLEEILFFTLIYMQIPDEQIVIWSNNPNRFVEDEDEETLSYSVRISAQYLILSLGERFKSSIKKLCSAVARIKQKGEELRAQGEPNWWKYQEVCLLALGYVQPSIQAKLEDGEMDDNFKTFLLDIIVTSSNYSEFPFLHGQSFWCSSRYVELLPEEMLTQILHSCVVALQNNENSVLRVFSVKSLFGFCDFLKSNDRQALLLPHLEAISAGLLSLATQYKDSILSVTLETLTIVVKVEPEFTSQLAQSGNLLPILNALFIKYGADHQLSSIIGELIGELVKNVQCYQVILEKTVPTLLSILPATTGATALLVPSAFDLTTEIIRKGEQPPNAMLFKSAFPLVVERMLQSEDTAILQNGGETIRAFVACACDQVVAWQDGYGSSGLSYVVQIVCKLLDPKGEQSSALLVGKLVNTLLSKACNVLGENFSMILRSVLSKLQQSKYFTVTQSLLMVFIQLFRTQIDATLEFLSTVPGPTGKSALDYVLNEWCSKQSFFIGGYEIKASSDALCKLLSHAIATNDSRFEEILVAGEQIVEDKGIMTRSKSKKDEPEFTQIPVAVKLFKLIVGELTQLEAAANQDADSDEYDDDDDEDFEEMGEEDKNVNVQQIIDSMFAAASQFDDDDDDFADDDPDTMNDPINELHIKDLLAQFIRQFAQESCFANFADTLNAQERDCLVRLTQSITS